MPIDEVKFFCACAKNCIGESAAIQKAGLSQTVLRQIKRGKACTAMTVGLLASTLNVSVKYLLGLDEE